MCNNANTLPTQRIDPYFYVNSSRRELPHGILFGNILTGRCVSSGSYQDRVV